MTRAVNTSYAWVKRGHERNDYEMATCEERRKPVGFNGVVKRLEERHFECRPCLVGRFAGGASTIDSSVKAETVRSRKGADCDVRTQPEDTYVAVLVNRSCQTQDAQKEANFDIFVYLKVKQVSQSRQTPYVPG